MVLLFTHIFRQGVPAVGPNVCDEICLVCKKLACLGIMPTIVGFVCSGRIVLVDILKYCHSEFLSLKFVDRDILLLL